MIKICHVSSAHNNDDIRILEKECVSLAKKKEYDVFFVARGISRKYKDVNIEGINPPKGGRLNRIFRYSKEVIQKSLELDADIYHIHDPELLLYVKRLKKKGKKVIFDSHEDYYNQIKEKKYIPKICRNIIAFLYKKYEDKVCKYLDGAVIPCLIDGKNIFANRVFHNAIISNAPIIDSNITYNYKNMFDRDNTVCTIGTLSPDRGIENLIDACYLTNTKLVLAGNFQPYEFGEYLKSKKSFQIVDYKGYCNREEVKKIYLNSTICAATELVIGQTILDDVLPTKVYESMLYSLPFIIYSTTFTEKFLDKYKCGITVDTSSVDEIAKAIKFLIDNKETSRTMGEIGHTAIMNNLNWEYDEKKLYELYKKIINI